VSLAAAPATPLYGRTAELDAVVQRLTGEHVRLLTLTGPAGVGKTRLALAVGERLVLDFPDGVVFVDLTVVRDPTLVLATIAQQLGLIDTGSRPLLDRLREYLADRTLLLILDNFEHVLTAASELPPLLAAAAGVHVLVTSRIPLRLRSEQTIRLFPLPVPEPEDTRDLAVLVQIPSVALLVERVQAQRADFTPTAPQVPVLIALTRQLDGLPLAIELAAAQAQSLPLAAIVRRLQRHVQSLRWDAYDVPERHHSLEAALGWGYQLLSGEEQRLFRHLGVFVGRVTPDALAAVVGESDEDAVLDRLIVLAEQSLVVPAGTDEDAEPTFRMLETVRQYARELLEAEGEAEAAARSHAAYYLALAERADPELRGRDQRTWRLRLEAEHDNLRAALRWLLDTGQGEPALQLAGALGHFWWLRGHFAEGGRWLEEAARAAPDAHPRIRIRALLRSSSTWELRNDREPPMAAMREALALAEAEGNQQDIALALKWIGAATAMTGDIAEGEQLLQNVLAHWTRQGDEYLVASTLADLGAVQLAHGRYQEAAVLLADSATRFRAVGSLEDATSIAFAASVAHVRLGNRASALRMTQQALRQSLVLRDRWLVSYGIEATLLLIGENGSLENRLRLLGAMHAVAELTGFKPGFLELQLGQTLDGLRDALDREEMQAAYREGRGLGLEDVVALALDLLEPQHSAQAGGATGEEGAAEASPLSEREQQVLRLVAEGLTSKQIGQQLFLSSRTVDHHLTAIFNKLGVDTRAQAVAVATRDGLI
jgi:predicted ATPase/DNA-binding CsgD family transcriptional regulator